MTLVASTVRLEVEDKAYKKNLFQTGNFSLACSQVLPADAVSLTMNIEEVRKVLGVSSF